MWSVFVNKKNFLQYMERYKFNRNQNLRYTKRYTKIWVYERYASQKKPYEVIYQPFFCSVTDTVIEYSLLD